VYFFVFFFSSRRRHTRSKRDWSSDVCSSDLRRKYSCSFYKQKVDKIRQALPGLAITSDVIVGFPGETEEEFKETYDFIKEVGYSELHVFPFSRRTGTPAARMKNQVEEEVKNKRVQQMIELSDQLAKEYASAFENEVLEVIPEEHVQDENHPELLVGYTDNYLKVKFEGTPDMIGKIVRVKM